MSLFEKVIAIEKISNVKNTKGVNIFAITGDILPVKEGLFSTKKDAKIGTPAIPQLATLFIKNFSIFKSISSNNTIVTAVNKNPDIPINPDITKKSPLYRRKLIRALLSFHFLPIKAKPYVDHKNNGRWIQESTKTSTVSFPGSRFIKIAEVINKIKGKIQLLKDELLRQETYIVNIGKIIKLIFRG